MLTTASRSAPRARAPQSRRASVAACATCQQRRGLRFGPWGSSRESSRDADLHRDARKRHRNFRYQYMESLMRKRPWSYQTLSEDTKGAIERAMTHDMESSAGSRGRSGYINIEQDPKSWSDEMSGVRPGRNIEDVERDLMNHLFHSGGQHPREMWRSPLGKLRNYLKSQQAPKEVTPQEVLHATTSTDANEGNIDPITNRRVSSSSFTPKFEDVDRHPNLQSNASSPGATLSSGPKEDADRYGPVKWNEPDGLPDSTPEEKSKKYEDLDKYKPARHDNPNAPPKLTPEEKSKQYKDLNKYKGSTRNEPHGLQKPTPEEQSKSYDDLHSYSAVRWNEPDGLRKLTPEELSKEYKDLDSYGPVQWNEPDGLQKKTPEELSKSYTDLSEYSPVKWDEPDGLRRLTPEEESKNYDDLQSYEGPRTAKASAIEAHEASQMDTTVRGNTLPPKVDVPYQDPGKEYKDLDKYRPVYWNEPDGLRKLTPEELSKNYEDLHLYGASKWNEPDGLRVPTPEEKSKQYEHVREYAPMEPTVSDGVTVSSHPKETSKDYDGLRAYPVHPEEATKRYEELDAHLDSYVVSSQQDSAAPTGRNAGNGGMASGGNGGSNGNNGDSFDSLTPDEVRANVLRRARYLSNPKTLEGARAQYREKWDPVMEEAQEVLENDQKKILDAAKSQYRAQWDPVMEEAHEALEKDQRERVGDAKPRRARWEHIMQEAHPAAKAQYREQWDPVMEEAHDELANDQWKTLEAARAQYRAKWNPIMDEGYEALEKNRYKPLRNLTGNYARDFPEEFSTSWSTVNSSSRPTLLPKGAHSKESVLKQEAEASSMDESFPATRGETSKLEPALDRQIRNSRMSATLRCQLNADPYSKAPQGLETSYAEECGEKPTWPTMVKHYGHKATRGSEEATAAPTLDASQSQTYKILAYDPMTDSIRTAETSSDVHDTSSPQTPGDIVLNLSNPAKFFPHLSSLEAEGYQMISGNGDVLVLRKVRPASPDAPTSVTDSGSLRSPPVNPVDMMGKPVTGNFASPTGFVNYDTLPEEKADKPAPPFRSNIDVRREEPVFSGSSDTEASSQPAKKKKGLGKKVVIGTVYVAGGAYAVGVMAEYFSTAGSHRGHGVDQFPRRF